MLYCGICGESFEDFESLMTHVEIETRAASLRDTMRADTFAIYDNFGRSVYIDPNHFDLSEYLKVVREYYDSEDYLTFFYFDEYRIYEEVRELLDRNFMGLHREQVPHGGNLGFILENNCGAWRIVEDFEFENDGVLTVNQKKETKDAHEAILLQIEALLEELSPAELASLSVVIAEKVAENF